MSWKKSQTLTKSGPNKAYRCPCCNSKTLHGRGQFELCPVCYWEDDGMEPSNPSARTSLAQARANFQQFGACEERWKNHVRPPKTSER